MGPLLFFRDGFWILNLIDHRRLWQPLAWYLDEISVLYTSGGAIDLRQSFFTPANAEGSAAAALIFNGGTLKFTGTTTTSQPINILATGGTIDSYGNIVTLTGAITGAGGLTISGTNGGGEVHLNGLDSVPITVDATGMLRGVGPDGWRTGRSPISNASPTPTSVPC